MAAAQPVVYKAMATTGSSRATEAGRVSALKHVDIFCGNKRMGLDAAGKASHKRLTEDEICNPEFFKEFATYLAEHAIKSNGDLIMGGTATQYISALKEYAQGKYSSNPTWIDKSLDTWYPFLRLAIETNIYRRQIVNGDPIAESSQAIGRNLLISINDILVLMFDLLVTSYILSGSCISTTCLSVYPTGFNTSCIIGCFLIPIISVYRPASFHNW